MNRRNFKLLLASLIVISCFFWLLPHISEATNFNFDQYGSTSDASADKVAKNVMGVGINVIRIVATGISIVMLSYMGIKYMMAAPSEKAEFKKSATIFVVGAILVFAAGNIFTIIANFASNNVK